MTVRRLLPALLAASFAPLSAQVAVGLRLEHGQYVAGEAVSVTLTMTNNAGQDMVFQDDGRVNWLDFVMKDEHGAPVSPLAKPAFGAMRLPVGQTLARSMDLTRLFRLSQLGTYSVHAVVRQPGPRSEGFLSNRLLFTITNAHPVWSQKVGVAGRPGETREYRVMTYSGEQKTKLYVQVNDVRSGSPIQTYSLGEAMMFRKPMSAIDSSQNLHVLYLSTPAVWVHACIDTDGRLVSSDYHKRGVDTDPALVTLPGGQVQVAGSLPYDPKAERDALKTTHKLSERPSVVYR